MTHRSSSRQPSQSPEGTQQGAASRAKALPGKRRRLLVAPCVKAPDLTHPKELLQPCARPQNHVAPDTAERFVAACPASAANGRPSDKVQDANRGVDAQQQSIASCHTAQTDSSQHHMASTDPVTPVPDAKSACANSTSGTLLSTGHVAPPQAAQGNTSHGSHLQPGLHAPCPVTLAPAAAAAAAHSTVQRPADQAASLTASSPQGIALKVGQAPGPLLTAVSNATITAPPLQDTRDAAGSGSAVHTRHARLADSIPDAQRAALSTMDSSSIHKTQGISSSTQPAHACSVSSPLNTVLSTSQLSHISKTGSIVDKPGVHKLKLVQRLPAVLTASLATAETLGMDTSLPKATPMLGMAY